MPKTEICNKLFCLIHTSMGITGLSAPEQHSEFHQMFRLFLSLSLFTFPVSTRNNRWMERREVGEVEWQESEGGWEKEPGGFFSFFSLSFLNLN